MINYTLSALANLIRSYSLRKMRSPAKVKLADIRKSITVGCSLPELGRLVVGVGVVEVIAVEVGVGVVVGVAVVGVGVVVPTVYVAEENSLKIFEPSDC